MKNKKKIILFALLVVVVISLSLINGLSMAKYAANSLWNYYLKTKEFYFNSSYANTSEKTNTIAAWNQENISFDVNNYMNDSSISKYDIDYTVTCDTDNENVSCIIGDTETNSYDGTIKTKKGCISSDDVDVSEYNLTSCTNAGYTWDYLPVSDDLYFNLSGEFESVNVTLTITSTNPYKKILIGKFVVNNSNNNANISMDYTNDVLTIVNNEENDVCGSVEWNNDDFYINPDNDSILSYTTDDNGYINKFEFKISSKNSLSYEYYSFNDNVNIDMFTLTISECD